MTWPLYCDSISEPARPASSWAFFQSRTLSAVVNTASPRSSVAVASPFHLRGGGLCGCPYILHRRGYFLSRLCQFVCGVGGINDNFLELPKFKVCYSGKLAEYARYGVDPVDDLIDHVDEEIGDCGPDGFPILL